MNTEDEDSETIVFDDDADPQPRSPRLYVHGITAQKWAKRYGLSLEPRSCSNCGTALVPEIPFASLLFCGLKSKPHGCSPEYDLLRMAASSKADREQWANLSFELRGTESDETR